MTLTDFLTADQMADPPYIMVHDAANANRDGVQRFLNMEATCASALVARVGANAQPAAANWASFPVSQRRLKADGLGDVLRELRARLRSAVPHQRLHAAAARRVVTPN